MSDYIGELRKLIGTRPIIMLLGNGNEVYNVTATFICKDFYGQVVVDEGEGKGAKSFHIHKYTRKDKSTSERRISMYNISNIDSIDKEYMYDADFQTKLKTVLIGDSIGTEKFYVNIDYVKPGGKSTKYHSHSQQEEFFLIMNGHGILRLNGEEILIKTGDVISKPSGKCIAHQFINNSSEILQILDIGTREKDDVITYPDESIVLIKDRNLVFNISDNIKSWTSEPNE